VGPELSPAGRSLRVLESLTAGVPSDRLGTAPVARPIRIAGWMRGLLCGRLACCAFLPDLRAFSLLDVESQVKLGWVLLPGRLIRFLSGASMAAEATTASDGRGLPSGVTRGHAMKRGRFLQPEFTEVMLKAVFYVRDDAAHRTDLSR